MDIMRFEGGRMKISLSKEELELYDIDLFAEGDSAEKAKEAIETALALVRLRTGYIADREENFIRLFPCKDGGCEIFVLKKDKESAALLPAPKRERAGSYLCVFDEESQARAVKKRLAQLGEESSLYADGSGGRWYLISEATASCVLFLEEFGQRTPFDPTPYIREHFGAVEV